MCIHKHACRSSLPILKFLLTHAILYWSSILPIHTVCKLFLEQVIQGDASVQFRSGACEPAGPRCMLEQRATLEVK